MHVTLSAPVALSPLRVSATVTTPYSYSRVPSSAQLSLQQCERQSLYRCTPIHRLTSQSVNARVLRRWRVNGPISTIPHSKPSSGMPQAITAINSRSNSRRRGARCSEYLVGRNCPCGTAILSRSALLSPSFSLDKQHGT
ncbi:hypothetical protein EDD85DRAFT_822634 [Armillaria nabsnona]|nr:hypothetical protein EDD85DRAFT_822634 [Armillaria nabsnona]